jgi:Uma2 family endonuclease
MVSSRLPRGTATAADLVGRERCEVIDGTVEPKAAPSFEHGDAQIVLGGLLGGYRGPGGGGRPGGWWLATEVEVELETHQVFLPDVAGWRRDRVPERPSGRPVRIRPDWICEILSPSTAARDLGAKLRTYHHAGLPHYWIVDPEHQTLTVHRWHAEGFLVVLTAARGELVRAEPFVELELPVGALFGDEPAAGQ